MEESRKLRELKTQERHCAALCYQEKSLLLKGRKMTLRGYRHKINQIVHLLAGERSC